MAQRVLPNLELTGFFDLAQDGWDDEMNLNLLKLSVLAQGRALSKVSVEPGGAANGAVHILDETHPTHANQVAIRDEGAWVYVSPYSGWLLYNDGAGYYEKFNGTEWAELAIGGGGGGISDAPSNGTLYGRKNGAWEGVPAGGGSFAPEIVSALNSPAGKAYTAKGEYVAIAGNTETDLLNVSGDNGFVNSIFIAIDDTDYQARELTRLKVYVDGSSTASVDVPLASFFAAQYNPQAFKSKFLGFDTSTPSGGGDKRSYHCYFSMPFSTGMRITLTPPSGYGITNCWWQIGYHLADTIDWGLCKHFRATWATGGSVAAYARHTLIDEPSIEGALLGTTMLIDGTSFTYLEGNVRIFVDGESTAAFESSGLEDYFNAGFYFQGGPIATDYYGLTKKDNAGYAICAYRFHVPDPVRFSSGLKIDVQNGDNSQQAYTGPSIIDTVVWYYTSS